MIEDIFTFGGSLLNEFICVAYSKIREKRMNEYKDPKWQAKVYKKFELFEDVVAKKGSSFQAGRTYVPGNYTGGIRDKKIRYNNLLELQYKHGPCPIFLTFTTNTGWPEIKCNIHPYQFAADRPDIAIPVYYLKQQELMRDVRNGNIFGNKAMYFSNSVEFQKKGHTHCHTLIRLRGPQPETGVEIDKIITARAPVVMFQDPTDGKWKEKLDENGMTILDTESKLFKIVIGEFDERTGKWNGNQIHHHSVKYCGVSEHDRTTVCKKGFPKSLSKETYIDDNSGICFFKRIHEVDRWVVSYSPFIAIKYRTHHNVDIANHRDPRYCFKYCFKEQDRARITIEDGEEFDETKFEMEGLYVSASESMYRIKGYELNKIEPSIKVLNIHLDHNSPVFKRIRIKKKMKDLESKLSPQELQKKKLQLEKEIAELKEKFEKNPTDVVRYFNRPNPNKGTNEEEWKLFHNLKYLDYKEKFMANKDLKKIHVKLRKSFKSKPANLSKKEKVDLVDNLWLDEVKEPATPFFVFKRLEKNLKYYRIQGLYPSKGELFFLRILLLNKPARGYKDLLTVKKKNKDTGDITTTVHESFQDACVDAGLFSDKNEHYYTLNEIVKRKHLPSHLRNTYCYLIQEEGCPARRLLKQFATHLVYDWEWKPGGEDNNPNFKIDDNSTIRRKSIKKLLLFIKDKLNGTSSKMRNLSLPDLIDTTSAVEKEFKKFENKEELWEEFLEKIKTANREQRCLIMLILGKILLNLPYLLFVNAMAGRGKTYWIQIVALFLRFIEILCELWATTGKGAIQYPYGNSTIFF